MAARRPGHRYGGHARPGSRPGHRRPGHRKFLAAYCTGYDRFERYLLGRTTACPSHRSGRRDLRPGRRGTDFPGPEDGGCRTIVTVGWSLQRLRHGEQAPWMGLTLAAMLGQIGLPGGGFGHGYGSMNEPGLPPLRTGSQRCHRVSTRCRPSSRSRRSATCCYIPARRSPTTGGTLTYPDISRVLGGRQPFSPPPEPAPAPPRTGPRRHRGGARAVLDADGPARRHRRPVHHRVRTRRLLRIA